MGQSPRYTTFREGELEATLQRLDPQGHPKGTITGTSGSMQRSKSGLVTSHVCTVMYPDATSGTCRYTRGGPAWHIFRFEHTGRDEKTTSLPVMHETQRIGNTLALIEEHAQTLSAKAFTEAIAREQRDYFRRALPPPLYKVAPGEHAQMKVKESKLVAGQYALCIRVGRSLLPTGTTWSTLPEAVTAWKKLDDVPCAIGCCCRWKRRWEEPRFNPLHADPGYPYPGLSGTFPQARNMPPDASEDNSDEDDFREEPLYPRPSNEDIPHAEPDSSPDPLWADDIPYPCEGGVTK